MKIPLQLQNPELRFYLCRKDEGKLPAEKSWNETNNYMFFEERLQRYKGNYGVCCGYGNLVVLDFDDKEYYDKVKVHLPDTFTVLTANKRLPHMYYYLEGTMFKKTSVRNADNKTLMDIQADRAGVVAPGSVINRKYYIIYRDLPITIISADYLVKLFQLKVERHTKWDGVRKEQPKQVMHTKNMLCSLGIMQTAQDHYKCPFHEMHGKGNLCVMSNGALYCFHEQKYWHTVEQFVKDYDVMKKWK
jgi:hypothetical protein